MLNRYTNDAYVEDREGFEPPNNGFAVHPFKPLRHLSLLISLEVGLHSVTMTCTSSQGVNPIPLL